jgi:hypothetical protein
MDPCFYLLSTFCNITLRTLLNYWKLNPRNQCSGLLTLSMVGYYDLVLGFCSRARENAMNSYLTQQIGDLQFGVEGIG